MMIVLRGAVNNELDGGGTNMMDVDSPGTISEVKGGSASCVTLA